MAAEWGPIRGAPAKIEALEKRVAELEEKLGGKWPPEVCKFCGERQVRMRWSRPTDKKMVQDRMEMRDLREVGRTADQAIVP